MLLFALMGASTCCAEAEAASPPTIEDLVTFIPVFIYVYHNEI